jgi:hypothetical protein
VIPTAARDSDAVLTAAPRRFKAAGYGLGIVLIVLFACIQVGASGQFSFVLVSYSVLFLYGVVYGGRRKGIIRLRKTVLMACVQSVSLSVIARCARNESAQSYQVALGDTVIPHCH